jgi:hypothetical protein
VLAGKQQETSFYEKGRDIRKDSCFDREYYRDNDEKSIDH